MPNLALCGGKVRERAWITKERVSCTLALAAKASTSVIVTHTVLSNDEVGW